MELITLLLLAVVVLLGLAGLIWVSDCDILLLWKTHFGVKADTLAGKVIWITGASSGIGEFLAYELAKNKCRLVLSARRENELERVKKDCILRGSLKEEDILVLTLDVVDLNTHSAAVEKVLTYFGHIDILVNNAGRTQRAMAVDTSNEVDRQMMELNVLSVLSLTKAVLPDMIKRNAGHIVVTSSVAGKLGAPFSATYSATKFALQGWFDALRTELSENNIHVTMICPGPVFSAALGVAFTAKAGEKYGKNMQSGEKRMSTERCAELMVVAIANKMYEVWISISPPLLFVYLTQYSPTLARWVGGKIGMKTINRIREGRKI